MTDEPEEVVTESEEEVVDATTITAEAAADAKVEDGASDDDESDDGLSEEGELVAGEPLVEGKFTINVAMVIHPSDDHIRGQLVTITASSHAKVVPVLISKRMQDLGKLPAWLSDAIEKVNGNLEKLKLEAEKKKQKAAADKAKAQKAAADAKAKKDAPKKAKLEKEKARKAAAKAKAEKQKADAKAKAEKQKQAAKVKAEKEQAAKKKQADKLKTEEAKNKPKEPELKPGEAVQPDMFDKLFGGNKK